MSNGLLHFLHLWVLLRYSVHDLIGAHLDVVLIFNVFLKGFFHLKAIITDSTLVHVFSTVCLQMVL